MMSKIIKISPFCLSAFLMVSCNCRQIETRASVNSKSSFTEIFSDSVIYIVFNENFSSKKKFKLKHHPDVSDSVTHINYYLKKDKEKIYLEYLDGFPLFGEKGAYFKTFEPIKVITDSIDPSNGIVDSSIFFKIEDSVIFPTLEDKRLYILERKGKCKFKRIPVTLGSGLQYTKYSE